MALTIEDEAGARPDARLPPRGGGHARDAGHVRRALWRRRRPICAAPASPTSSSQRIETRLIEDRAVDDIAREYLLIGLSLGELRRWHRRLLLRPPDVREQARAEKATALELVARARGAPGAPGRCHRRAARPVAGSPAARHGNARPPANGEDSVPRAGRACFDASRRADAARGVRASAHGARVSCCRAADDLRDRIERTRAALTVPVDKLAAMIEWLTDELRRRPRQELLRSRGRVDSSSASSRTSRGAPTTGTTAICTRASRSTRTCPSAPAVSSVCSPTKASPAITSSTRPRSSTWSAIRVATSRACS